MALLTRSAVMPSYGLVRMKCGSCESCITYSSSIITYRPSSWRLSAIHDENSTPFHWCVRDSFHHGWHWVACCRWLKTEKATRCVAVTSIFMFLRIPAILGYLSQFAGYRTIVSLCSLAYLMPKVSAPSAIPEMISIVWASKSPKDSKVSSSFNIPWWKLPRSLYLVFLSKIP